MPSLAVASAAVLARPQSSTQSSNLFFEPLAGVDFYLQALVRIDSTLVGNGSALIGISSSFGLGLRLAQNLLAAHEIIHHQLAILQNQASAEHAAHNPFDKRVAVSVARTEHPASSDISQRASPFA